VTPGQNNQRKKVNQLQTTPDSPLLDFLQKSGKGGACLVFSLSPLTFSLSPLTFSHKSTKVVFALLSTDADIATC